MMTDFLIRLIITEITNTPSWGCVSVCCQEETDWSAYIACQASVVISSLCLSQVTERRQRHTHVEVPQALSVRDTMQQ